MAGLNYTALGYCTEVDIENFLLTDIDSSFSAQVEDWIAAAEQRVNRYLGYTTASGILAEEFSGEVAPNAFVTPQSDLVIFPRKTPIISFTGASITKGTTSIALNLTSGGSNTYNIPASNDQIVFSGYDFSYTGSSLIHSFDSLKNSKFFISLSYIGGYTQVPADIRLATVNFVADTIMRHSNKEGLVRLQQGRVEKEWKQVRGGESDFVLDAQSLLNPYRMTTRWII